MIRGQGNSSLSIRHYASPGALQAHPALIYAHGFGQTAGAWNRTGEWMAAQGYGGLAYDARGHGGSDRNAAALPYTGDQFADGVAVEHVAIVSLTRGQPTGRSAWLPVPRP